MKNTQKSNEPSFYNRLIDYHTNSLAFHKKWSEEVREHLQENVHRDPTIRPEDYYVHLCDCIENWLENQLDRDIEDFKIMKVAAGLSSSLTSDEYDFIEKNIGPLTKENVGSFVLFQLAEEVAEDMAFGNTVTRLLN